MFGPPRIHRSFHGHPSSLEEPQPWLNFCQAWGMRLSAQETDNKHATGHTL